MDEDALRLPVQPDSSIVTIHGYMKRKENLDIWIGRKETECQEIVSKCQQMNAFTALLRNTHCDVVDDITVLPV